MAAMHVCFKMIPTPMAGLALGIASLGATLENALPLGGSGQYAGAVVGALLLLALSIKFLLHPNTLALDLRHPVIGSVVPTFAMAWMVVSASVAHLSSLAGNVVWLLAVVMHLACLGIFLRHRLRLFNLAHMVPSWFVPPVGIIVADITLPAGPLGGLAEPLLLLGLFSYAILLPAMILRFMFYPLIADAAKPTIAIMAAPASLSLAGYLSITQRPSLLLCAVLLGIALLMTLVTYLAFLKLLRLPFSPGYAAFTFPMVIGATALYKAAHWLTAFPAAQEIARRLELLATVEVCVATAAIGYVSLRYLLCCIRTIGNMRTMDTMRTVGTDHGKDPLAQG